MLTVIEPRFTLTATLPATDKSSVAIVPVVPVMLSSSVAIVPVLPVIPSSSVSTLPDTDKFVAVTPGVTLKDPPLPPCMLPETFTLVLLVTLPP